MWREATERSTRLLILIARLMMAGARSASCESFAGPGSVLGERHHDRQPDDQRPG